MANTLTPSSTATGFGSQLARLGDDPVFVANSKGELVYVNPAAERFFGYSGREFRTGGLELLMGPGDSDACPISREADQKGYARGERWMQRKNGQKVRMEISIVRFENDDGESMRATLAKDISHQRKQEYEHRLLEAAASAAPIVVCVTDEEWRILWANPGTEQTSGYALLDLTGRPAPLRRYLEESMPDTLEAIEHKLGTAGSWTGQVFTRRKNGEVYPLYGTISVVEVAGSGERRYVAALSDISKLRDFERKLHHLALYDPVTALPNRDTFIQRANVLLSHPEAEHLSPHLLVIDIDGFNALNETLGYETGDLVLKRTAERLHNTLDGKFIFSRSVGDSFAVLITGVTPPEDLVVLVERIHVAMREPLKANGHHLSVTASIGISAYPEDGTTPNELLQKAIVALRRAKQAGTGGYAFYQKGAESINKRFIELAAPMRQGLENGEFQAHFQPIVDTLTRRIVGMETLARWKREDGTIISPYEFIPVAERTGMIATLSESMLRQTCAHLKALDRAGHRELRASLNLSAQEISTPRLSQKILQIIAEVGVPADSLNIEITESHLMHRPEETREILSTLQKNGMRIVIDDFGTGYSSLAYLTHFNVNGIKLDRFFMKDIPGDEKNENLLSMMIALGDKLDIPVVAEGVETEAQVAFLMDHGCPRFQGYLVAPALPSDEFVNLVKRGEHQLQG